MHTDEKKTKHKCGIKISSNQLLIKYNGEFKLSGTNVSGYECTTWGWHCNASDQQSVRRALR